MNRYELPHAPGQLVWSPADPSLGLGIVTKTEGTRIWVRFVRLQEERTYTTRGAEHVVVRYEIGRGERVRDRAGREHRVERRAGTSERGLAVYELEDGAEAIESDLVPEIRDIGPKERLATLNLVHPSGVRRPGPRARTNGSDL